MEFSKNRSGKSVKTASTPRSASRSNSSRPFTVHARVLRSAARAREMVSGVAMSLRTCKALAPTRSATRSAMGIGSSSQSTPIVATLDSARRRSRAVGSNDENTTLSNAPAFSTTASVRASSPSATGAFSSTLTAKDTASSTSASRGTRSPANARENQPPASSTRSSSSDRSPTGPVPSVVRSSKRSWITTTCPSRVSWTSSSTMAAPNASARRNAAKVFSGQVPLAPRWAITSGRTASATRFP